MSESVSLEALCPRPGERNVYNLMVFKQALVARLGVEEGFRVYKAALELAPETRLANEPVVSSYEFAKAHGAEFNEILQPGEHFRAQPPRVIGEGNHRPLSAVARAFFVARLDGVRVGSSSSTIETEGRLLFDFQGSELQDSSDQLELDPRVFSADYERAWTLEDDSGDELHVGEAFASLVGPHTPAFGHWLAEYLPKYVAATALGALPPVPVLIDSNMPPTHRAALELVLAEGARIVEVPQGKIARVERLWFAPALSFWPLLHAPHGKIDAVAAPSGRLRPVLAEMRRRAERSCAEPTGVDRLFFARRPELRRRMANGAEIEAIAAANGFKILYPEEYEFKEQVRFVRHARHVIAPDGSAILLTLFAQPGTKLAILSHRFPLGWVGFSSMAEDLDITIVTGPVVSANDTPGYPNFGFDHHADYRIDPAAFKFFLYQWARA